MPTIEVDCYIRHCTDTSVVREHLEWRALKAVKVLKGEGVNGSFNFQINGSTTVITNANKSRLLEELCQRAGAFVRQKYGSDICIVPIPNSGGLITSRNEFLTMTYARRIAAIVGQDCEAADILRWKTAAGRAHKGERSRSVDAHIGNLRAMRRVDKPVVIFDDVVTSGSQMVASKSILQDRDMDVTGMLAFAEVIGNGERSDIPSWRTAVRSPYSIRDAMDAFDFG